jgi:hypothetical protein
MQVVDRIVRLPDGRSMGYAQYGTRDGFQSSTRTVVWHAASTWPPPTLSLPKPVSG